MTELTQKIIQPELGLTEVERSGIVSLLKESLASVYTLAVKTKKFHWNVTGSDFMQFHELFDEQYKILLSMSDDIAEYIRQYGFKAPGTLHEFQEYSLIHEMKGYNPNDKEMIADLVTDYETLIRSFRKNSQEVVNTFNDIQAEDLFIGFMHTLTKQAWFLRAHLE